MPLYLTVGSRYIHTTTQSDQIGQQIYVYFFDAADKNGATFNPSIFNQLAFKNKTKPCVVSASMPITPAAVYLQLYERRKKKHIKH